MSVEAAVFIEKFKNKEINGAEIKLTDSLNYYIVQKHGEKTELYMDIDLEYPEEPPLKKEQEMSIQPLGLTEFGMGKGVLTSIRKQHEKKAELVKVLKEIEEIEKYIDFNRVSEIVYNLSRKRKG